MRTKKNEVPEQQVLAIDAYTVPDALLTIGQQLETISELQTRLQAAREKLLKIDAADGFAVEIGEPSKIYASYKLILKL